MFSCSANDKVHRRARRGRASTAMVTVLALLSLSTARAVIAADGTNKPGDWPFYHGNDKSWRYSELDQINKSNVKRLKVAWIHQPGDITGGLQATPIVIDGVLYYSSANNKVQALDAASGKELWRYVAKLDPVANEVFFSASSRGVTVAGGKVFLGTLDGRLIALDQKTGKELWATQLLDTRKKKGANFTSPPTLAGSVLVAGPTGGDIGQRGQIYGVDAETGKKVWEFDTIHNDPASWPGNSGDTGGGSAWLPGTYDAETDTVYIGTGNPAPDYYGEDRKGDNLYTSTLLALDAKTGKLKWHHQEIPHDVWDYDSPYESILFDRDGKKLLLHPNKSGYAFLYERNDGKIVNVWPYIENINFVQKIDPTTGELIGRNEPVPGQETYICPTLLGGRSWNAGAYSPKTGLWYTNRMEACNTVVAGKSDPGTLPLSQLYFGVDSVKVIPPRGKEAAGWLDAIDPMTGEKKWSVRYSMPGLGGVLATAGGLVFNGDITGVISAYDADKGDVLWNFYSGSGVRGGIVSYSAGGKQYIVVPTGLGSHAADFLPSAFPDLRTVNGGSALVALTVD